MSKSEQISHMTNIMAKFVGYTGKVSFWWSAGPTSR